MVGKTIVTAILGLADTVRELKPVIDNERVRVWDVTWTKGQTNPAGRDRDVVVMWLTGAKAGTASFSREHRQHGCAIPDYRAQKTIPFHARKTRPDTIGVPASAREEAAGKQSRDRLVLSLESGRADAHALSRQRCRRGLSGRHGPDVDDARRREEAERVQGIRCSL